MYYQTIKSRIKEILPGEQVMAISDVLAPIGTMGKVVGGNPIKGVDIAWLLPTPDGSQMVETVPEKNLKHMAFGTEDEPPILTWDDGFGDGVAYCVQHLMHARAEYKLANWLLAECDFGKEVCRRISDNNPEVWSEIKGHIAKDLWPTSRT